MKRAGAAAWLLLLFVSAACRRGASAPAEAARPSPPDQIIGQFTMDSFAKGAHAWTLESPKAYVYEPEKRVDVDQPRIRFYDKDRPGALMTAGKGRFRTDNRDLFAWDGVVITSTDGARLQSDWMKYASARDVVVSTAPVTLTRGSSVVRGIGWEAKPDLSHMVVHHQTVEWSGDRK
jgi:LPS export ABC transporter protein LptC